MRWELASRIKYAAALKKQLYAGKEQPDAVVICATLGKKIVVTREFRTPLGGYEYGFPAGLVDEGETVPLAAARELLEETGLHVDKIVFGSPSLFSSAGMTDGAVQIVCVTAIGKVDTSGAEPDEDIEVILMSRNEAAKLLKAQGRYETAMISAKAWPLIYHFVVMGELFQPIETFRPVKKQPFLPPEKKKPEQLDHRGLVKKTPVKKTPVKKKLVKKKLVKKKKKANER